MGCWYICSGGTLFLNKIILTELHGDIQVLGGLQMTTTCVLRFPISTRILGRRTAPFSTCPHSSPRPAWCHPNILVLMRGDATLTMATSRSARLAPKPASRRVVNRAVDSVCSTGERHHDLEARKD